MPLQKNSIPINFAKGVDTKTDPNQVQAGMFLALQNSVFDETGALTKRNGYANITSLPNALQTTLTSLNGNLLATGSNLYAYSSDTNQWLNQGTIQPVSLSVQPIVRVSTSQSSPDSAVSSTGLTCTAYVDNAVAYYLVSDSNTGQQIVGRTALPSTATNPRVFVLGRYFIVTYCCTITATPHLQYIAIPLANPSAPLAAGDISTVVASISTGYDAFVANNNLYVSWGASSTTVRIAYLTSTLSVSAPVTVTSSTSNLMSVTADISGSTPIVWATWYKTSDTTIHTAVFDHQLVSILGSTLVTTVATNEITSVATNGVLTLFIENNNTYSYSPNAKTDYISKVTVTQAGTVVGPSTVLRSVGLASKAFIDDSGVIYMLATYGEANQPTYFLISSTGNIYMRLAYQNGGGYAASQVLPSVTLVGTTYYCAYLFKDFLASVNKGTSLPSGTPVNGIYSQTGVNLVKFTINSTGQYGSEIANALHLTGGQLWEYDSVKPVEHGFHVYPENNVVTTTTGAGSLTAQTYFYTFCYEWTDNQGLLHRSAPSIPVSIVTTTSSSTNTLKVPTLRLTYKISPNPVRIVGYRWSTAQQVYYQFTSITSPTLNDTTADSVTITDTLADSSILGNPLLYTTGGVLENIAAPAFTATVLFKNRLFGIVAEDPNLLWYSKQVIQGVPVEMSDLLTLYVAPTTGTQGSTGPALALGALDDKLIIFKRNAIYYVTGTGPDITGANNDFSDPIFITASVGCANPNSIVLMPQGVMFQSDKGIWLLGRDLSTQYIGAPVEGYNAQTVESATTIPGTNQVRFVLDNGITLMYDYYQSQWGTFNNVSAISATLFEAKHTYLNQYGQVFQETPGTYLDGSLPVLMSLTTSWINLAGLQGYERFYFMNLLGRYYSPFILNVGLAYDYNPSLTQSCIVLPDTPTPLYGNEAVWGSGEGGWGGTGGVFEPRMFPDRQKCEAFQITLTETYDSSYGIPAGKGFSLSGMDLTVGAKKSYRTNGAGKSFGGNSTR